MSVNCKSSILSEKLLVSYCLPICYLFYICFEILFVLCDHIYASCTLYTLNVIFVISCPFRERIGPKGVVGGCVIGGSGTRMKIDLEKLRVLQLYSSGVYL